MCWPKRSSGRKYDSAAGVGTMIGNRSGKIVGCGIRSKICRVCDQHNTQTDKPKHACYKNWNGSSKAMEPDVAAELVEEVEKKSEGKIQVHKLIMDDDCTTVARLRNTVDHEIIKWSDLNHVKKQLGNSLYAITNKYKCLTGEVIKSLQKWFSYAIKQNRNNPESFKQAVKQIVPHAFGDHESCGNWCAYSKDPDSYKHKTFPHGKDLTGEALRNNLNSIFQVFCDKAEQIAPAASSNDVESFNNVIVSKAPKARSYGSSCTLTNRVNCAVSQKNIGHSYIEKVNTSLQLSPGSYSKLTALKRDRKRKRKNVVQNSREFKLRKIELKNNKSKKIKINEVKEGCTYHSGVDLTSACNPADIEQIPTAPSCKEDGINKSVFKNSLKVYFDLETGGLYTGTDILQIAACCDDHSFSQYVTPLNKISPNASAVTGLTAPGGVLMLNNVPVPTVSMKEAFVIFLSWLQDISHSGTKKLVLIGHNVQFDARHLCYHLIKCNLTSSISEFVVGFCDTLPLFRFKYPELPNHKQETLAHFLLKENYDAHNASADVYILHKLIVESKTTNTELLQHSFSLDHAFHKVKVKELCKKNFPSLQPLVDKKILSTQMANKIASSGLKLCHLKLAFLRNKENGIHHLFSDMNGKSPRVTKSKCVCQRISSFFEKEVQEE